MRAVLFVKFSSSFPYPSFAWIRAEPPSPGRSRVNLCDHGVRDKLLPEDVDERTRLVEILAGLEGGGRVLVGIQVLQVPGIELAQVARRAIRAEVLLGAVHHPEQLGDDFVPLGIGTAPTGELLEDPRVTEGPAGDHHRVRAGGAVGLASGLSVVETAGDDH